MKKNIRFNFNQEELENNNIKIIDYTPFTKTILGLVVAYFGYSFFLWPKLIHIYEMNPSILVKAIVTIVFLIPAIGTYIVCKKKI